MRVPYASISLTNLTETEQPIYDQILARRGTMGLLPLDFALLHSFPICKGWNSFFSAIKDETSLRDDLRGIAICRVALLCQADVQWKGHFTSLQQSAYMDTEKMKVVQTMNTISQGNLSNLQWSVLRYADAMTKMIAVEDKLFENLKASGMSSQALVEITATIAAYNCVSRFLVALQIEEKVVSSATHSILGKSSTPRGGDNNRSLSKVGAFLVPNLTSSKLSGIDESTAKEVVGKVEGKRGSAGML